MIEYENYLPILAFLGLGFVLSIVLMGLATWRSKKNPYFEKSTPYECGFDAFDNTQKNARGRFNVQFYLVAILFIIFDLEIAFLFPWAISLKKIGVFGFWSMMAFLSVLTLGFLYEYCKGALEWE
jgi:NADH-quinone oxidoreductase subunit A